MIPLAAVILATMLFLTHAFMDVLAISVFSAATAIIVFMFFATGMLFATDYVRLPTNWPQIIRHLRIVHLLVAKAMRNLEWMIAL